MPSKLGNLGVQWETYAWTSQLTNDSCHVQTSLMNPQTCQPRHQHAEQNQRNAGILIPERGDVILSHLEYYQPGS